jgi:hypothetical protein
VNRQLNSTAVRNSRVYATDGHNYFSRSGSRLLDAIGILAQMLHPELFNESLDPKLRTNVDVPAEAQGKLLKGGLSSGSGSRSMGLHGAPTRSTAPTGDLRLFDEIIFLR